MVVSAGEEETVLLCSMNWQGLHPPTQDTHRTRRQAHTGQMLAELRQGGACAESPKLGGRLLYLDLLLGGQALQVALDVD